MAGRPTKYNKTVLTRSRHYLEAYETLGDAIPSIVGLARYLKLSSRTLHKWRVDDDKAEFMHILQVINDEQEKVLVNRGLVNEFNSNITKLVLGKHGYSDKHQTTIDGSLGLHEDWLDKLDA